jgi:hypothetical protein
MKPPDLTTEQIEAFEGMLLRRMENTNETRQQAGLHIINYLIERRSDND